MFEIIIALFIIALFPITWYAVQYGVLEMAKLGIFWDIVPEGYARAYVRNGKLSKMKLSFAGHEFIGKMPDRNDYPGLTDEEFEKLDNLLVYDIVAMENNTAVKSLDERILEILLPAQGIVFTGPPGFYETYTVKKMTWVDDSFQTRTEDNVDKVLLKKYAYGLTMNDVELEGTLPFNIKFMVNMQVTNPAIAWFRVNRYLDVVLAEVQLLVLKHFKDLAYTDFVGKTKLAASLCGATNPGTSSNRLADALDAIKDETKDFERKYGVKVHGLGVYDIEPASEEVRKATVREEEAKLKAAADAAEATGKAKTIGIIATAEAAAIETKAAAEANALRTFDAVARDISESTKLLKGYGALEKSANVTIVSPDLNLTKMLSIPTGGTK